MRRLPIALILLIVIHSVSATDWSSYMADIRHTGYTPDSAPTTNNTIWNFTALAAGDVIYTSPTVADGMVFFGGKNNILYALNAYTGVHIWNYTTGGDITSTPAVHNGRVFFGSFDAKVYALDAYNGTLIWNYTAGSAISGSPVVSNGNVIVGSMDHNVYALNENTGDKTWNRSLAGSVYCSPAVYDAKVFVVVSNKLYALSEATGGFLWSANLSNCDYSSPTISTGKVLLSCDDKNVSAYTTDSGGHIWTYHLPSTPPEFPVAVHNGKVFVSADDAIYVLNEDTGVRIWNTSLHPWVVTPSPPAVANGMVFVQTNNGKLIYALDEDTGAEVWSYDLWIGSYASYESSPTIVDGIVYVAGFGEGVYAFGTYTPTPPTTTTTIPSGGPSGGRRPPAERPHLKVEPSPFDIGIPYLRECSTKKLYLTWTGTKTVTVSIRPSRELSKHLTLPYTIYAPANKTITLPVKGCLGKDVLGFKGVVNFYVREFPEQVSLPVTLKHMKEPPKAFCGNGVCDEVEDIWNCPQDCLPLWAIILLILILIYLLLA